jgi:hypothetical protein
MARNAEPPVRLNTRTYIVTTTNTTSSPTAPLVAEATDAPLMLTVSRAKAAMEIEAAYKIGSAIRNQRLREMRDLDEARREKQEWTLRTTELLNHLFGTVALSEQWNAWTPPILPEFAEFGMFRDLFDQEMKVRLTRLSTLASHLNDIPERTDVMVMAAAMPMPTTQSSPPSAAPVRATMTPSSLIHEADTGVAIAIVSDAVPVEQPVIPKVDRPARPLPESPARPSGPGKAVLIVRLDESSDPQSTEPLTPFLQKLGIPVAHADPRVTGNASVADALDRHDVGFAVAIVARPPDSGAAPTSHLFDLGCCVGRLGMTRVCTVAFGPGPSDARGLPHVSLEGGEGWHLNLARHLKRGGVDIDLNRLC